MGLLSQIDAELQKDLINFIKEQDAKPYPHVLGDAMIKMVLEEIIKGNARMSGCAKNDAKGTMYIELTFWENKENDNE
jgi:hypothetical protein